jgi:hypothetical protein
MGRVVGHLRAKKYEVIDLTIPGWIASKENIDSLVTRMSELKNLGNFAVIMDLHGNSTFRFSQFDGTQALPIKEGKKYHFPGEILPVSDDLFTKINDSLKTILLSAQDHIKIIIPPLPRYVFDRCCTNTSHCKNFCTDNYQTKVLDSCTHLRNILKKRLAEMGCANYWVLDGLGAILGVNSGTDRGGNSEIIAELRPYLGSDGVHLNEMGYKNLANVICATVTSIFTGKLGKKHDTNTSLSVPKVQNFYWRGFNSPCGSTRPLKQKPKNWSGKMKRGSSGPHWNWRGGSNKFCPY